ncbi:MAG TPA: diguanylate cyclase, partial [Sphingobacterium sp.]|nr:diguanylate cyclase [Sphingobacterium sp.]
EGTIQDITASHQAMEQIKKQNETLCEIAWLQSHSIRAPLTRIMSLIYLSKELDGGGKSTAEIMDLIMDSAKELDAVIAQITVKTNLIHH